MSSIRKQQSKTTRKIVVKPILTNPFTLEWPTISEAAQSQIEAALRDVLMPLVHAREAQFKRRPQEDNTSEEPPVASTSKLEPVIADVAMDTTDQSSRMDIVAGTEEAHPPLSKHAQKRAKAVARQARRTEHLPPSTHEMTLKSGKVIQIPDQAVPDKLKPILLLDKGKAVEERPEICQSLLVGINVVTKALEAEVQNGRRRLAGLDPIEAAATTQDSLRLFIPAPKLSTRRQRRELRNQLHPEEKGTRRKKGVKGQKVIVRMPSHLTSIPKNDAAFLHTLQEAKEELSQKGSKDTTVQSIISIFEAIKFIETQPEQSEPAVSTADAISPASDSKAAMSAPSIIQLPKNLVETLLFSSGLTEATRSILISLLMRYDSRWFSTRNIVRAPKLDKKKEKRGFRELSKRTAITADVGSTISLSKPIRIIFVATGDIYPLAIVQHILTTTAARNSTSIALRRKAKVAGEESSKEDEENIYLVPMRRGFEEKLCELLAIRRAAVLALTDTSAPHFDTLLRLVKHHFPTPLSASWLIPVINDPLPHQGPSILPTHIKHLQTSVPVDMKAARAEKKATKGEQKGRKRKRSGVDSSPVVQVKKAKQDGELLSTQAE